MPDIVYTQDNRLLGVTAAVAVVGDTRLVVANPNSKKLITVAFTGTAFNNSAAELEVQASSAEATVSPHVVAANDTYVFALGARKLFRFDNDASIDDEGFTLDEFTVESEVPLWLVEHNGFLYMPWSTGGVIVYTQHGVLVARYDGILAETSLGAIDVINSLLVLADSKRARGVCMTLNSDGTLTANDEFALNGCKGVVALIPDDNYLAVACRDRITLFTIEDPTAPVYAGTLLMEFIVNDLVRVDSNSWWVASDTYVTSQLDRFDYRNAFAVFVEGRGVYAVSAISGRIIGEGDFMPLTAADIVGGTPPETFYLLTEDGNPIVTESDERLLLEDAP